MALEPMIEKWTGSVSVVKIGATKEEGGSRKKTITIGGQKTLPFLYPEGELPHRPVVAAEIWDTYPKEWPEELLRIYGDSAKDAVSWAEKCVKDFKAELLCIKLQGAHPDFENKPAEEEAKLISRLLKAVPVPLIILGCGDDEKDNQILPLCCEAAKGERCLIGDAVQDNYKTITAAVLADGHNIIAESPIDINIAKQLNILISDMGLPLERIVLNPTIGALGYGMEYAYSIMERSRLAALCGDKTIASPFICFVGQEAWKAKETKSGGPDQGIIWETLTSTTLVQAGADILVMRHPEAIDKINGYINELTR